MCVCACVLPSVMQKTLRKARSWAEMGGSLQCRAKMLDLKERKVTKAIRKVTNGGKFFQQILSHAVTRHSVSEVGDLL